MSYSPYSSRSITQWIILFRNTRRSVCAEIVLRSLAGYRLMGLRNFLPEDIRYLHCIVDGEAGLNVVVCCENPCSNKYEQTSSFPNGV